MWPNPQETADLVTFTEEILMENLIFCAADAKWRLFGIFIVNSERISHLVLVFVLLTLRKKLLVGKAVYLQ